MRKKGFLTTIATILLMVPLFMITQVYLDSSKNVQNNIIETDLGMKVSYYHDDIKDDLLDMMSVEFDNISYVDDSVWINFSSFGIKASRISEYNSFISSYKDKINLEVSLNDIEQKFNITPYGFVEFDNNLFYYSDGDIEEVFLTVKVNQSIANFDSNNTPPNNGAVMVHVDIVDVASTNIYSYTASMKKTGSNTAFQVSFNDGSSIDVEFENYNGNDGTLYTSISDLDVNITNFDVKYANSGENVSLKSDAVLTISQLSSINKSGRIVFN
jgi:hypothetical protein